MTSTRSIRKPVIALFTSIFAARLVQVIDGFELMGTFSRRSELSDEEVSRFRFIPPKYYSSRVNNENDYSRSAMRRFGMIEALFFGHINCARSINVISE